MAAAHVDPMRRNRTLLNPHFEAYRLDAALDQDHVVAAYPLPPPGLAFGRTAQTIGFKQVQSTLLHNHLGVGAPGQAMYVDQELNVVLVYFTGRSTTPSLTTLLTLPSPISSLSSDTSSEPPSAHAIDPRLWLVSDGTGRFYLLSLAPDVHSEHRPWRADVLTVFEHLEHSPAVRDGQGDAMDTDADPSTSALRPTKVHAVKPHPTEPHALALLSSTVRLTEQERPHLPKSHLRAPVRTVFDLHLVRIPLSAAQEARPRQASPPTGEQVAHTPLETVWRLRGDELPSYVHLEPLSGRHLLGAPNTFHVLGGNSPSTAVRDPGAGSSRPSPAEAHPDGKKAEATTTTEAAAALSTSSASGQPAPSPFSWTQSHDTVSLSIPLPSTTPKRSIGARFTSTGLSLVFRDEAVEQWTRKSGLAAYFRRRDGDSLGRGVERRTWDEIDAEASTWEWERPPSPKVGEEGGQQGQERGMEEGEEERDGETKAKGLLTIHLAKANEGTRWPHLFSLTPASDLHSDEDEPPEVQETLSSEYLRSITASLDKYTVEIDREDELDAEEVVRRHEEAAYASGRGPGVGMGMAAGAGSAAGSAGLFGEGDEEADGSVGKDTRWTWVEPEPEPEPEHGVSSSSSRGRAVRLTTSPAPSARPSTVLAWPFPVSLDVPSSSPSSFSDHEPSSFSCPSSLSQGDPAVIKSDIDGLVFRPPPSSSFSASTNGLVDDGRRERTEKDMEDDEYEWTHISTFPALAFVLASKKDAHHVLHHIPRAVTRSRPPPGTTPGTGGEGGGGGGVVFAFESPLAPASHFSSSASSSSARSRAPAAGTMGSGAGNLFVYYAPERAKDVYAKQRVVRLSGGDGGGGGGEEGPGFMMGFGIVRIPLRSSPPSSSALKGESTKKEEEEEEGGEEREEEVVLCLCERQLLVLRGLL